MILQKMASKERLEYMCGTCNERFDDLTNHIVTSKHDNEDKICIGVLTVCEQSGKHGYLMIRFDKTYGEERCDLKYGVEAYIEHPCAGSPAHNPLHIYIIHIHFPNSTDMFTFS